MKLAIALVIVGCAPANQQVGEVVWQQPDTHSTGVVGPLGHTALLGASLALLDPTGVVVWDVVCQSCAAVAFDRATNVYTTAWVSGVLRFEKHRAADGGVEWTHTYPIDTGALVVVDANDIVWLALNSPQPIDFGGGPIGTAGLRAYLARFDGSGGYLSATALDFLARGATAAADTGIIINRAGIFAQLVAVDDTGATRWTYGEPTDTFAVHANGELTVVRAINDNNDDGLGAGDAPVRLVRLDTERHERWKQKLTSHVTLTAVAGGVIVVGTDSVAGSLNADVTTLEHFDADGHRTRQIGDVDEPMMLLTGAEIDEFRLHDGTTITSRKL